jgi:hypothetical protein
MPGRAEVAPLQTLESDAPGSGTPASAEQRAPTRSARGLERRRRTRAGRVLLVAPPLLAFCFAQLLLVLAAVIDGSIGRFFSPSSWARFDSGLYLQVAQHGYTVTQCTGPAYPPHSTCGTVGWAPLYPGLLAALGHLGLTLPAAGVVLSALFAYLTLQVLWVLIRPAWTFAHLACVAFAACFPGMVYSYAVFPVSLLTFLTVACLLAFVRRRYVLAGVAGALCTWAFATGPLMIVVLAVAAVVVDRREHLVRVLVQTAGIAFAGFVALMGFYQVWAGDWTAYFKTSSKYGDGLHDPVATFVTAFSGGSPARYSVADPNAGYSYLGPRAQTAFVAALVIGLAVWTLRRSGLSRRDWVLLVYTVVAWLVPLVAGPNVSRYRMEALLVPCVGLCTPLPRALLAGLVVVSSMLAVDLAVLFTQSQIV